VTPSGALHWVIAAVLGMAIVACAHVQAPTGGPEDETPPAVLVTRPDTLAVVPGWDSPVVFVFSERISEQGVEEAVQVSPRTSPVRVDRGSDEIRVSLRRGWEPGVIYHVMLAPTIQDLFNNRLAEPVEVVFSTGPEIPDTRVAGEALDRITGEPEVGARVEAIRLADSLVYAVPTDSAGNLVLARIPTGEYLLRAFRDLNRNRALEVFEPRDSALITVAVGEPVRAGLRLLMPDSTAPILASVERVDSVTVELEFDDYLDPAQTVTPAQIRVVGPDGSALPIARAAVGGLAPRDTVAQDTTVRDTVGAERAPLPSRTVVVELAPGAALVLGAEYRVYVEGIENVVGRVGASEDTFEVPEQPAEAAPPPAGEGEESNSS
jgi:hypothetical protein